MTRLPRTPARPAALPPQRFAVHPLSLAVLLTLAGPAHSLPQGGTVVGGQATIQTPSSTLQVVTQGSGAAIIDWRSFSIGAGEKVRFDQPSSSAVLLNRVTGYEPTGIFGQMQANGRIFLLNPQGVLFGAGARIDVGGMVASTLSISNADFLASRYSLAATPGVTLGEVRNEGTIRAPGGTVVLAGPAVTNTGSIEADRGRVGLAAAGSVLVDVEGDGLVFFNTQATAAAGRLQQLGRVRADGGTVELRAAARASMADTVLNMDGVVQARSLGQRNGRIVIDGGSTGITAVNGTLDGTGAQAGQTGGAVTVTGHDVLLGGAARVDASGDAGGGRVRIGGGWQGGDADVRNAENTRVAPGAVLKADALAAGDGGTVVAWSDRFTSFSGVASARGGALGGNGGSIETSGKQSLEVTATAGYDAGAPAGRLGNVLLDPNSITVDTNPNQPGNGPNVPYGGNGAITVNPSVLQGANATITLQARDTITFSAAVDLSAKNNVGLIAQAGGNITVNQPITTSGAGSTISLQSRDAGSSAIAATGAVSVNAALNAGAGTIVITNNGGTTTNQIGANLTANGGITITGGAQINGTVSASSTASITFNNAVTGGTGNLTTTGGGDTTFAGPVTLASLNAGSGGGTTSLAGDVTTSATQAYGTLTIGSSLKLSGTTIALNGTVDATGRTLTLAPSVSATIGNTVTAGSVVANTGATSIGADVTTTGDQSYAGLTVTAPAVLSGADITLGGAVTGAALTVKATGTAAVNATVGTTSFTSDGTGTTTLGADVTTSGTQSYSATTLGGNRQLTASGIGFGSLNAAGKDLTLTTDALAITGATSGLAAVTAQPRTATTTVGLTGGAGTLQIDQPLLGKLGGNGSTLTIGRNDSTVAITSGATIALPTDTTMESLSGAVNLGTVTGNNHALTFSTSGPRSLGGGSNGITALDASGAGTTTLNGNVTASVSQAYGAIALNQDTTLSAPAVTIGGVTAGIHDFTVSATTTTLNGNIASTGALSFGAVKLGPSIQLTGATISVGAVDGGGSNFTVTPSVSASVASVTAVDTFTTNAAGTTTLGGNVTTTGPQNYNSAALGANAVLTGPSISFNGNFAAGTHDLALQTNSVSLGGSLTGTGNFRLAPLNPADSIAVASTAAADRTYSSAFINGFAGTFASYTIGRPDGTGAIDAGTGGTFTLPVNFRLLGQNAPITLGGTIDGAGNTLATSTTGTTTVGATLNNVASLTVSGPSSLSGTVKTTGTQTYTGAVTLTGATTLDATTIGLSGVTGNNNDLDITASSGITLTGINGVRNLSSTLGTTTLGGSITTTGTQTYGNLATSGSRTLSGTTIGINGNVSGSGTLTLDGSGGASLRDVNGIGSLVIAIGAGPTTLNGVVQTTSTQSYGDVTLAGNTTLTGSGVTLGAVTAGANNFAVNAPNATLKGDVTGTGSQSYGGLTLNADVTLSGSVLSIGNAVSGAGHNFTVTPSVSASLKAVTADNFTANGPGTTTLGGDVTTVNGAQIYNNTNLSAAVALTANSIELDGAFNAGANNLAMQTLGPTFGPFGSLSGSADFRLAPPLANNTIGLNSLNVADLNLSPVQVQQFLNAGFTTFTLGRADGTGAVAVATGAGFSLPSDFTILGGTAPVSLGNIFGGNHALTVSTGGNTAFLNGISNLSTLQVSGPASLASVVNSNVSQTYGGTVTVAAGSTLSAPQLNFTNVGTSIAIGANSLTLNTRDLNIAGAVTGTGSATLAAPTTNETVSFAAAVPSTSAFTAADIGKFGTVSSLTLGRSDGTGAVTVGALTLPANTTVAGQTAPVGFQGAVTGANHALTVATLGATSFAASPTGLSALTVGGPVTLPGGTISTTGNQSYGNNLTLTGNQTLDAQNITFTNTLALGTNNLTLQYDGGLAGAFSATGTGFVSLAPRTASSTIGVAGLAGTFQVSQAALDNLSALPNVGVGRADGTGTINVGPVTLASNLRVQSGSGDIQLLGGATGSGLGHSLTVDTAGLALLNGTFSNLTAMTVSGPARLTGPTTVSTVANGNVTFGGTVDGNVADAHALVVNAGGATVFGGAVGGGGRGLLSLATDAGGTTTLRGNVNATTVSIGDTLALDAPAVTVTAGAATFGGTVDSSVATASALTLDVAGATNFNAAVGALHPLASLTTDASGGTRFAGGARATGAVTVNDAVTLTGPGTFVGSSASFASTVDGAQVMTVTASGLTRFGGNVGATTPLLSLTTDAAGSTTLNGSVRTSGSQSYGDAVTLTAPVTLTGTDIGFLGRVDGGQPLTLNASGAGVFAAAVGATTPLASLTIGAGGSTSLAADVTTSGAQAYIAPLTLTGPATLSGTNLLFGSTVNGAQALTVNGSGTTVFTSAVGNSTPLASLTTDSAGSTQLGGNVTTTGAQTFGDAVLLIGNATLSGASVGFTGTVDGNRALTIDAAGATTFGAPVGATTPLASLTTNAGGITTLTGNVTTTGVQAYGDDVVLAATAQLNASGIAFGGNLAAGAFGLTTRSDALTLAGSASGTGALDIAPATAAGTIGLAGAPGTLQLDATLLGGLGSFSGLTIGRADGTGAISAGAFALSTPTTIVGATAPVGFIGDIAGNNQALAVTSGGTTRVAAALTGLASFSVPGAIRFDGGTVATSAAQNYSGTVALDGNATLSASAVQFNGAIDGPGALAVTAPGGTTFGAPVGAGTALASVAVTGPAAVNGGAVRTTGTQAWNGALTLGADTTLTGTDITFGAAVDGAQALDVAASGTATFAAPVGATTALTSLATANAARLAGNVSTTGAQAYGGAVTLTGDAVLSGSSATFGGSVDGAQALASNVSGTTTFGGAVGGTTALVSLTVANAAQVDGGRVVTSGAQSYGGAVTLGADTTVGAATLSFGSTVAGAGALSATAPGGISLGGNVTTTGAQSFTGPVTLAGDVVASGSSLAFNGTVDGAHALQLNAPGATVLAGPVGTTTALASLATDAAGTTSLGGSVRTTGAQSILDPATLTADATFTGSAVTFGSTLDGARAVTVNAADTRFGGAVGATTALASLTTDAAGTTRLGGNVTTTGAQTFGDAVQLDAAATLTATSLAFGGSLDGAQALTAAVAGNTAFNGAVGATTPLASLAVAGTTTMNAGSVATTGSQTYGGAVTLARDTSLGATGLGFGAALDGAHALAIQNTGSTAFGAAVGATTPLASLVLTGGGPASLAGASVDTVGAQSYGGNLALAGNTRLTGASLAFGGNVTGAQDLQLQTDALATAGGVSGSGVLSVTPLTASTGIGIAGGAGPIQVSQAMLDAAGGFTQHVIGRADGTGNIAAGALTLSARTTLQTATGNISLNGAVNGGFDLALNSGGTTRIAGPVGTTTALRSLATDGPGTTLFDQADASGSAQVVTTGAQTYADPVSATVPVRFAASALTATQAANHFAGGVSGDVGSLALVDSGDLAIGNLALSAGGSIQAEGTISVGGTLALNGGTLTLTSNATPTGGAFTDPDLVGKALVFRNSTLQEASATIFQTAGSAITSAPGSLLVLRTPKNGSLLFDEASNKLLGDVSAVAGTLNDTDATRFGNAALTTVSVLRLNSSEIHVAGAPPASGDQTVQRAGFEADAIKLTADKLSTGTDGQIRARLPFDNLQGSQTSLPGLTLVMSPQALAIGGGFGTADPASWIQVKVGNASGGYLTVRPKGQNGQTAIILLAGAEPKPFYDGAGKLTEVRVFYNGDTPRTPQESGALNAVIALVEEARHARFEEAVRTENVSSRLRSGVIAEVGSGRPATVGRESIRMPEVCDMPAGKFKCE